MITNEIRAQLVFLLCKLINNREIGEVSSISGRWLIFLYEGNCEPLLWTYCNSVKNNNQKHFF